MQNDEIKIGMSFGLLTVIGEKEKIECKDKPGHYATMIKCRCSCPSHTELYVLPSHLKNHLVTSCGCKKKGAIKVGLKSGELEVIEIGIFKEKNGYQQQYCKCRCNKCGSIKEYLATSIVQGKYKTCGCEWHKDVNIGDTFDYLTVIKTNCGQLDNGSHLIRCRCKCGKEILTTIAKWNQHRRHSCGCKMRTEKSKLDVKEGSRFGHLLVVKTGLERTTGERYALCKCSCDHNKLFEIPQYLLRKGIKSCGCGGRVAVGDVFGRLTVVDNTLSIGNRAACKVRCSCGKSEDFIVKQSYLKKGATRSCGCLLDEARKTHGEAMTRLYHIWKGMKDRCRHSNRNYAKWYVNNGISYAKEWEQYIAFRDWALSHGYSASLTLDRIDSTKGYSPSNCRWATREEQSNNKSDNVILEHDGRRMTVSQWARFLGIKETLIRSRIRAGWSDEEALTLKSGTWRSSIKRD